jgi:hypothetical protein
VRIVWRRTRACFFARRSLVRRAIRSCLMNET